jgi:glycosyltransferase involved in cell wall biosynthesis
VKLAVIAHHVAPIRPPFAGGVESLTWYLTRWLAERGHEVVLFALPSSEVPGVEVRELAIDVELSPMARADVSMPPDAFIAAHHAYSDVMAGLADDPEGFDLVHVNSLHYLPVLMAPLVPVPTLLTLHTPPTPWLESALLTRRSAPALSAVSTATAAMWSGVVHVPDVVRNGVDHAGWPAGPGGTDLVWCGRMVPEKAPHLAIDAAGLAGLRLRLAGPIVDPAYWEAEVAPRLDDRIHYVGHLDHRALADLVGRSRVALMTPAWEEPFGLVAAEAMATGTPVAAFARGGLTEIVTPDVGALARPGDVASLAAAIERAARLPRREVRAAARRRLGIDAMGVGYERLYAKILAPGRDPALEPA